ncbi:MAG: hypothetical protein QM680_03955 [Luteolibacter sp.]
MEARSIFSCDRCGREALGIVGDEALCEDCYHEAGACCGDREEDAEPT